MKTECASVCFPFSFSLIFFNWNLEGLYNDFILSIKNLIYDDAPFLTDFFHDSIYYNFPKRALVLFKIKFYEDSFLFPKISYLTFCFF